MMVAHRIRKQYKYAKTMMSNRFALADLDWNIVAIPETKKILIFEDAGHAMMYGLTSGTFGGPDSFFLINISQKLWSIIEKSDEYLLMERE